MSRIIFKSKNKKNKKNVNEPEDIENHPVTTLDLLNSGKGAIKKTNKNKQKYKQKKKRKK